MVQERRRDSSIGVKSETGTWQRSVKQGQASDLGEAASAGEGEVGVALREVVEELRVQDNRMMAFPGDKVDHSERQEGHQEEEEEERRSPKDKSQQPDNSCMQSRAAEMKWKVGVRPAMPFRWISYAISQGFRICGMKYDYCTQCTTGRHLFCI